MEKDPVKAAVKLTKSLCDHHTAFLTLIYGQDITEEQASEAKDAIQRKVGSHVDITLVRGRAADLLLYHLCGISMASLFDQNAAIIKMASVPNAPSCLKRLGVDSVGALLRYYPKSL